MFFFFLITVHKFYFQFLKIVDLKTGEEKQVMIAVDDGIRPNTTLSDLAKLKPVFKKDGSTTAGILDAVLVSFFY